jgi:hypothetical protein
VIVAVGTRVSVAVGVKVFVGRLRVAVIKLLGDNPAPAFAVRLRVGVCNTIFVFVGAWVGLLDVRLGTLINVGTSILVDEAVTLGLGVLVREGVWDGVAVSRGVLDGLTTVVLLGMAEAVLGGVSVLVFVGLTAGVAEVVVLTTAGSVGKSIFVGLGLIWRVGNGAGVKVATAGLVGVGGETRAANGPA